MILDKELIFSTAQEVKSGTDNDSQYTVDLGKDGDAYNALWFVVQVDTAAAAAAGTDPKLNIKLQTSAEGDSYTSLYETGPLGTASLTAGTEYKIRIPVGMQRYLKVVYEVSAGASFEAGKYTAFLTPDVNIG